MALKIKPHTVCTRASPARESMARASTAVSVTPSSRTRTLPRHARTATVSANMSELVARARATMKARLRARMTRVRSCSTNERISRSRASCVSTAACSCFVSDFGVLAAFFAAIDARTSASHLSILVARPLSSSCLFEDSTSMNGLSSDARQIATSCSLKASIDLTDISRTMSPQIRPSTASGAMNKMDASAASAATRHVGSLCAS